MSELKKCKLNFWFVVMRCWLFIFSNLRLEAVQKCMFDVEYLKLLLFNFM